VRATGQKTPPPAPTFWPVTQRASSPARNTATSATSAADPAARLGAALRAAYAYHRETEAMMVPVLAQVGDEPVSRPYHEHWRAAADRLAEAFAGDDPRRRAALRAAILLSLSFRTWQLLVGEGGLTDQEAAELASRFVLAAAPTR
jgi:hypothetical protein